MGDKALIERKLAEAREAAARDAWREAAEAAAAAAAAWPEPPGWFGRLWRRWRVGALIDAIEADSPPWRTKAGEICMDEARRLITATESDPTASALVPQLTRLGEEARRWGHPEAFKVHGAVMAWQDRVKSYEYALRRGEEAMGAKRYIDAVKAFEAAQAAFPSTAAGAALAAACTGARQEHAFLSCRTQADTDVAAGRYACAVARLEGAVAQFPRDDGELALAAARSALAGRDACLEGALGARAGEWGRAERAFAAATDTAWSLPTGVGTPEARWWQAAMAMQRGAPERALRCLEDAAGADAAFRRALALAALGRYQAAATAFGEAGRPEAAAAAAQAAAHRTFETERAIGERLEQQDLAGAADLATAHLGVEEDAEIRALLDGHLEPRRLGERWRAASATQRVVDAAERVRQAPTLAAVHTWLVALDAVAPTDDSYVADWITAMGAVLANLHASPAFALPHRAWTPDDQQAIKASLRDRVDQRLDAARDVAPHRERVWRDAWRAELAALELAEGGQPFPQLGELALPPGLWHWLGQAAAPRPAPGRSFDSQLFTVLYSPWGLVAAAWRAGDAPRAQDLRPASSDAGVTTTFGSQLLDIERGLAMLAQGDIAGWDLVGKARELLELRSAWKEALDAIGDRQVDELSFERARPFARRWFEVVGSQSARRWHITQEAEAVRLQLADNKLSDAKALSELDALLRTDPQNPMALKLRQMIEDKKVVADVQRAMEAGRFEDAVALARRKGSPEVRALVADFCFKILDENFNRGMSLSEAQSLARSARDLVPDNQMYREVARKLGVWG